MSLFEQLSEALDKKDSERPVSAWLKKNPLILSHATGGIAFPNKVIAEFNFGTDYRADFLTLGAFSGGWSINCIELEPPGESLFTRKGIPAKRLNEAIAQVDSWRCFIDRNRDVILKEISKSLKTKELVWGKIDYEPCDTAGWPIYHPKSWIAFSYHIIIGRRSALGEDSMSLKAAILKNHNINVMTYDRLIEVAQKFDSDDLVAQ